MAKQKARELLIKISDGAATPAFNTICGLNSKTIGINNNTVDVTTADCGDPGGALWREISEGIKSLSLSGNGIFTDSAAEQELLTLALSATPIADFEAIVPDLGTFGGAFLVTTMEYAGESVEGDVTYSVALDSSGVVTFTAAA